MQKARRHSNPKIKAPTACKRTVSGSFHSPSWGSFHLSLTVLVHYRSLRSIQPWRMVPPYSDRISRVPPYSFNSIQLFEYKTFTFFGAAFQTASSKLYETLGLVPVRSPLLRESQLISFPPGTQMFQFPGFTFTRLFFKQPGCPIRTSADQGFFAAPRSFSQLTTSFVVSESQGIPRTPLFASNSSIALDIKGILL